jgi:hypothetical protein
MSWARAQVMFVLGHGNLNRSAICDHVELLSLPSKSRLQSMRCEKGMIAAPTHKYFTSKKNTRQTSSIIVVRILLTIQVT